MKRFSKRFLRNAAFGTLLSSLCLTTVGIADAGGNGKWLSGDFHQHTYYTDGSTSFDFVMDKNDEYGLDWWANSEHGGSRNRDGEGHLWTDPLYYPSNPILGLVSGTPQVMWRWQSLRDFVFTDILENRILYPAKRIFSGLEWNVPAHEHCSTAIVAEDANAISAFEYQFDKSDKDTSRTGETTPYGTLVKANSTHIDSVDAAKWMQQQYDSRQIDNGWILFAHIERAQAYKIEHFRDYNNAAPDICFGFEGAPGHQANDLRGFGNLAFGGSYGGVGAFTAQVGGLWDALLGEGRHWFNFANSDYHRHYTNGGDDFYPGEYQKTWVYAVDKDGDRKYSLNEIADGMRSGNVYFAHGDLIDHLEFEAQDNRQNVSMGGDLEAAGIIKNLKLKIKFKSPDSNNCVPDGVYITSCAAPIVDHIDLIAGEIAGLINPTDADYTNATNPTAKVLATFNASNWETDEEGYNVIVYHIKDVDKNMYFRLRGTNLALNTPDETDASGNPLPDVQVTQNQGIDTAQEAWNDLWFYSNPIFVYVK